MHDAAVSSKEPLRLGPVRFDPVTPAGAVDAIGALIAARRGGYVVTPNVDHVILADADPELGKIYRQAALSTADGQPILWMGRLLGNPLPSKVSGADLIWLLMERAAKAGWRVFLLGATPEVSARAAEVLLARYPGLQIVGRDTSRWDRGNPVEPHAAAATIRYLRADLVVAALGCPKQEFWMARHVEEIAPAVAIGLGGSLDFVAGAVKRAPAWMSRMGLEWSYRLAQEPRRLAWRYLVRGPRIVVPFTRALRQRWFRSDVVPPAASAPDKQSLVGGQHVSP